jgi:hypothetical protein
MKTGILLLVFVYSFLFINLNRSQSQSGGTFEVQCPDGMAYGLPNGKYIRCEDFDLYHQETWKGLNRSDLYIK